MRKRLSIVAAALVIASICTTPIYARDCDEVRLNQNEAHGYIVNPYPEPRKIRCTCYIQTGYMKGGQYTYNGAIAGRKEDLGKTAVLYDINEDGSIGDLIGLYVFEDTGSHHTLVEGTSVDVWQPNMTAAKNWIQTHGDYVYIQVVEGKG